MGAISVGGKAGGKGGSGICLNFKEITPESDAKRGRWHVPVAAAGMDRAIRARRIEYIAVQLPEQIPGNIILFCEYYVIIPHFLARRGCCSSFDDDDHRPFKMVSDFVPFSRCISSPGRILGPEPGSSDRD